MDDLEKRIKANGLRDGGGGDTYGPLSGYVAILAALGLAVFVVVTMFTSGLFGTVYYYGAVIGSLVLVGKGWRDASWPWRIVGLCVGTVMILSIIQVALTLWLFWER